MDAIIECPKHNGRFDYPHRRGQGRARSACNLKTYPVKVEDGKLLLGLD